ncbi:MAG: nucleotidyltransferase family protein [Actinobacteria bacterium]|nr:nucleotidyltransferase family protein [Actinomycetota bacterium]
MKNFDEIKLILIEHKKDLSKKFKVKDIGIFGSYIRGEQKKISDVDILVDFFEPIGWEFVDLNNYLEQILGIKVDLVTPGALKQQMKDKILKELVSL